LAQADHLNASAASDVVFEHFSVFFASRNALRAVVKRHLFPGFEGMATKYMKQHGASRLSAVITNRMRDLKTLCDGNETKVVYIVPTTNQQDETGASRVLELAQDAGVAAAMPLHDKELTPNYYLDGFHLNDAGRDLFTANLADYLKVQLTSRPQRPALA